MHTLQMDPTFGCLLNLCMIALEKINWIVSHYSKGGCKQLKNKKENEARLLLLLLLFKKKKKKSKHERAKLRANIYQDLVGVGASRFQRMKEFIKEKINGFYCANLSKMSVC